MLRTFFEEIKSGMPEWCVNPRLLRWRQALTPDLLGVRRCVSQRAT